MVLLSSNNGRRCSHVIPESFPATPLRAERRFLPRPPGTTFCGWKPEISGDNASRGWGGSTVHILQLVQCARPHCSSFQSLPAAPSKACRAEEISPKCTKFSARLTRLSQSSVSNAGSSPCNGILLIAHLAGSEQCDPLSPSKRRHFHQFCTIDQSSSPWRAMKQHPWQQHEKLPTLNLKP